MDSIKFIIALIIFSVSFTSAAGSNTSERISGVADFLIERANDNYLYIFQRKIQNNKQLSCYFPTTFDNLTVGGSTSLKRLLTSRELWKNSIQDDLEFLTIRSLAKEIESTLKVSHQAVELSSKALDIINLFVLEVNGTEYPLNQIPLNVNTMTRDRINGFTYGLGTVVNDLHKFNQYKNLCPAPKVNMAEFKKEFDSLLKLNVHLNTWIKHIENNAGDLRLANTDSSLTWAKVCTKLGLPDGSCLDGSSTVRAFKQHQLATLIDPKVIENLKVIKNTINAIRNNQETIVNTAIRDTVCHQLNITPSNCTNQQAVIEAIKEIANAKLGASGTNGVGGLIDSELLAKIKVINEIAVSLPITTKDITSQVFVALKKIKLQIETDLKEQYKLLEKEVDENIRATIEKEITKLTKQTEKFDKLSKHILFFSSVADANSASEVKSILADYTLPSVSFFEKRKEGNHLMVTSYLGMSYNLDEDSQAEKSNNGIFAPIGLEYSRGVNWFGGNIRSASLMVSPVDFGHPINLKLNDIEEDFEFDEVFAPSVTFAMGFKDYPLTLGLGYQKGRQLSVSSESENRLILFFAFDMPLMNLHGD